MKVTGSLFFACEYKLCCIIFFFIRKRQIEPRFGILCTHVCIDTTGSNLSKRSFDVILHACVLSHFSRSVTSVRFFMTPCTVACQIPLSMEILQARILESVAMPFFRGSSQPRDQTWVCLHLLHGQAGSLPLAPPGKADS